MIVTATVATTVTTVTLACPQMFDGRTYQRTTLLVAFGYPTIVFGIVFLLNFFVWGAHSVNAIPFTSMFTVLVLWFAISVPLVFVGAYLGFKKDKVAFPVSTGHVASVV